MRRDHRLSRRLFLSDFGKGTIAVAILGTGLAACSSDSTESQSSSDTGTETDSDQAAASSTTAADNSGESVEEELDLLRWERVNLGFVSAYVLARRNEIAIVDTGSGGSNDQIEAALSVLEVGWADVNHVIVTHAHGDHVGGLDEVLTAASAATGYAGVGDIEGLTAPRDLVPVSDGDEVFGLNVIGTPGHTPGHISVFDPASGLLVAGDAMVVNDGRLAGPSSQFSSDIDLANASVKTLSEDTVETILVGHGDPITSDADQQLSDLAASL